jgi:stalled ribosome rescue protein Dom34
VNKVTQKRGYKRGYPVAVLIGLEDDRAVVWRIFSNVVKHEKTLWLEGTREEPRTLYNFHESIINTLRPTLKEGVGSIVLASPSRTNYAQRLITHVHRHHTWLTQGPNKTTFSETTGSAGTLSEVAALTRTHQFNKLISETTFEETEHLAGMLEKRLNASDQNTVALFSLKEIEDLVTTAYRSGRPKPEHILLTDKYLKNSREKSRIHRFLQIASNRNVKTRIVEAESPAGKRLTQLGGLVCLAQIRHSAGSF